MRSAILLVFLLYLSCNFVYAQSKLWHISTLSDQPYNDVILVQTNNDSLFVNAYGQNLPIPIDSIKFMKSNLKSYSGIGLFFGIIAGGILGNVIADNSSEGLFSDAKNTSNKVFGTIIGAGLGGIFGYATLSGLRKDKYYDFTRYKPEQKRKLLLTLISN